MNKTWIAIASGAALVAGIVTATTAGADARTRTAKATVATADGVKIGTVQFKTEHGHTEVRVRLSGTPGIDAVHGFHIHANDVPTNGDGCIADATTPSATWFVSADGHYNPSGQTHGQHVGDLPVVYVNADGSVETRFNVDKIKLADLNGKVVILHASVDNFNSIPLGAGPTNYSANAADATALTGRTGNAGDRIACGVITVR